MDQEDQVVSPEGSSMTETKKDHSGGKIHAESRPSAPEGKKLKHRSDLTDYITR